MQPTIRQMFGIDGRTDFIVLISEGVHVIPRVITAMVPYNRGIAMRYRNGANKVDTVYVPHGFRYLEKDGKYYVGKRAGNNSACEVLGPSMDPNCPGEDLSALIRADGIALGLKALYERTINWKLILILGAGGVAIIALIAIFGPRLF